MQPRQSARSWSLGHRFRRNGGLAGSRAIGCNKA